MLSNYVSLNTIIELVCLIVAIICLAFEKDTIWRSMIVLLTATFVCETLGRYVVMSKLTQSNHWVFNIFILFNVIIIHLQFVNVLKRYSNFRWIIAGGGVMLCVCYVYDLLNNSFFEFSMHTFLLMSVLFVVYGFIYYYYLLTDENYINLIVSPEFWLVSGILLFSFGSTACNVFDKQLYPVMLGSHHLTYYIFRTLNVILYSFWSYAFICKRWLEPAQQAGVLREPVNNAQG